MDKQHRIRRVQLKLEEEGIDALLVEELTHIRYLTGMALSAGLLLLTRDEAKLLVDGRYFEVCRRESPVDVALLEEGALKKNLPDGVKTLGFDKSHTPYGRWEALKKSLDADLVPVDDWILDLRAVKDAEEISLLAAAASLGSEGYDYVVSLLEEGITESEIVTELDYFWRKKGATGCSFDPIIAFGANSSMPHYHPGTTPLKRGDTVLIDIGVQLNGYPSDMTRTVFFGPPSPKMEEIYAICLEAQEKTVAACSAGVMTGTLDDIARGHIAAAGYGDHFSHGLGHGIGLDVHERPILKGKAPFRDTLLEPGMAITIEPGIYLPDVGGVRIEDTVIVTDEGCADLTQRSKALRVVG